MAVIYNITNKRQLNRLLSRPETFNVLFFWTELEPKFKELASQYPSLVFIQIETKEFQDIASQLNVQSVPRWLIIKANQVLHQLQDIDQLADIVTKYNTPTVSSEDNTFRFRLLDLIRTDRIMVFMKGSPKSPRCGFSRQVIQLLTEQDVKYSTFDILSDETVRQGLKTFSNWPTYPQIYVESELIGGLDVLKEMIASGEFQAMLK